MKFKLIPVDVKPKDIFMDVLNMGYSASIQPIITKEDRLKIRKRILRIPNMNTIIRVVTCFSLDREHIIVAYRDKVLMDYFK